MTEKFQQMLDKQKELDDRISEERCEGKRPEIKDLCRAIIHETAELEDHTDWKWWKKAPEGDKDEMREELIDILHFWMSIANQLGMTAEDIFNVYMGKNKVNHERQDNGY